MPELEQEIVVQRRSQIQLAMKRGVDVAGSLALSALLLPLILLVAIGVKCSSPGPVLYSQFRAGRGGRPFKFYKFRSMSLHSEQTLAAFLDSDPDARRRWNTYQKIDNDPRVTRFGRFIRRTSLDELPQFWNVLVGDMSLVGPRPCMLDQRGLYGDDWATYCSVRPGLTGLWQVSGRNVLTYAERVQLDAEYVREWSVGFDLKILLKTVHVVVSGAGSQ